MGCQEALVGTWPQDNWSLRKVKVGVLGAGLKRKAYPKPQQGFGLRGFSVQWSWWRESELHGNSAKLGHKAQISRTFSLGRHPVKILHIMQLSYARSSNLNCSYSFGKAHTSLHDCRTSDCDTFEHELLAIIGGLSDETTRSLVA